MNKNKDLIIKETFDLAIKNHQKNNLEEAQDLYNQILKIDPHQAGVRNNLGGIFKQLGEFQKAKECFKKTIEINPNYFLAHSNLGSIFQELGEFQKAIECYEKTIEIEPNHAQTHCNLGVIFQDLNEYHKAQSCYEKAIEINPNYSQAHNNLGSIFQKFEKHQKAIECYEKAIKADLNYEDAHSNLGGLFHELGENQKAINCYGKAIQLNSNNLASINGLVLLLPLIPTSVHLKKLLLFLFRKNNIDPNDLTDRTRLFLLSNNDRDHLLKTIETGSLLLTNDFIQNLLKEELFHLMLQKSLIADRFIEKLLTKLRSEILFALNNPIKNILTENFDFIVSLAEQTWLNEYVYIDSKKEINNINKLKKKIENDENINELEIAILGTYIPLNASKIITKKLLDFKSSNFLFNDLINVQIKEPLKEKQLMKSIETLDVIDDSVSRKVQEQYEEHPYPRWRYANEFQKFHFSDAINSAIKPNKIDRNNKFDNPNVLIAGCGTGKHPINATRFKNANILAVDLSLSSLAYAKRKTEHLNYKNIKYLHADILQLKKLNKKFDIIESVGTIHHMNDPIKGLKVLLDILDLSTLNKKFDIIESVGVLHHMDDPMSGWKVLKKCLKPGGLMRIGLYSELARQSIVQTREEIKHSDIDSSDCSMRSFRKKIVGSEEEHHKLEVLSLDFYSMSTFRDLLFHTQEYRFTIIQIKDYLSQLGLVFCGFESDEIIKKFMSENLEENAIYDLEKWDDFEKQNPRIFAGMYQFWCQKI